MEGFFFIAVLSKLQNKIWWSLQIVFSLPLCKIKNSKGRVGRLNDKNIKSRIPIIFNQE